MLRDDLKDWVEVSTNLNTSTSTDPDGRLVCRNTVHTAIRLEPLSFFHTDNIQYHFSESQTPWIRAEKSSSGEENFKIVFRRTFAELPFLKDESARVIGLVYYRPI